MIQARTLKSMVSIVETTFLERQEAGFTRHCFPEERYGECCRGNIDSLLPREQPATAPCSITRFILNGNATLLKAVAAVYGINIQMAADLVSDHCCLTLTQQEKIVQPFNSGGDETRVFFSFLKGNVGETVILKLTQANSRRCGQLRKEFLTEVSEFTQESILGPKSFFLLPNVDTQLLSALTEA